MEYRLYNVYLLSDLTIVADGRACRWWYLNGRLENSVPSCIPSCKPGRPCHAFILLPVFSQMDLLDSLLSPTKFTYTYRRGLVESLAYDSDQTSSLIRCHAYCHPGHSDLLQENEVYFQSRTSRWVSSLISLKHLPTNIMILGQLQLSRQRILTRRVPYRTVPRIHYPRVETGIQAFVWDRPFLG